MKTENLAVGQLIELARSQAGLTQKELAEEVGLSYRSIQEYEAGHISAMKHLKKIEEATGKPEGWILDMADPYSRLVSLASDIEEIKDGIREILSRLPDS